MKITRRQIRKIIREASDWYSEKHETLADMKFADGMDGEGDYNIERPSGMPLSNTAKKWLDWSEGYGLKYGVDDEELVIYFDLNDDVDGSISREAKEMDGRMHRNKFAPGGGMIIYTGEYL